MINRKEATRIWNQLSLVKTAAREAQHDAMHETCDESDVLAHIDEMTSRLCDLRDSIADENGATEDRRTDDDLRAVVQAVIDAARTTREIPEGLTFPLVRDCKDPGCDRVAAGGSHFCTEHNDGSLWLKITDYHDDSFECRVREFIDDNSSDHDLCRRARALKVGDSMRVGGGAAAPFTIERIS